MTISDWVLGIYFLYLIFVILFITRIWLGYRYMHRRYVCNGIATIIERNLSSENMEKMICEIEYLYYTCCRFYKDLYKVYPNVVFVFDDIHAVINTKIKSKVVGKKIIKVFNDNYEIFEKIHEDLRRNYPFYEFNEKQQSILREVGENDAILEKLQMEFKIENLDKQKNDKNNKISIMIGVIGIIISAVSMLVS